ncbi:MAG: fumarylacetoacetase [Planctomycetota bacterium]
MPYEIDETHDPALESWVESANDPETDFPIQNLPLCGFVSRDGSGESAGVRIGNQILDIDACAARSLTDDLTRSITRDPFVGADLPMLVALADADLSFRRKLRRWCTTFLSVPPDGIDVSDVLFPAGDAEFTDLPCRDYTDFYASIHHATNVGSMFRPDNPLLPNYKWIPVGYHGRASSVVASGSDIVRPCGQLPPAEEGGAPGFGPCKLLDYELEMGVVVGRENALGKPVPIEQAEEHILGLCLLNDWSARDMQRWEYQPLGPFLAKSFATSISPYIVTMEALAPFRCRPAERAAGDPQPLPHLDSAANREAGAIDITLEVMLQTAEMKQRGIAPHRISRGNFKDMYWTVAQMLTHHTSNGCNLEPGDLLGSGTVSGPARENRGCLLELTWDGDPWANPPVQKPGTARTPIELPTGETRRFLDDGDEVILKGFCERDGYRRIGFGECRGVVDPARTDAS